MVMKDYLSTDWSLLVDGTALFFGQRAVSPDKTMDYRALVTLLRDHTGQSSQPRPAYFFTATDETNDKQLKFNEMVRTLGWTVAQTTPQMAMVANPLLADADNRLIRFDASMAYALGRLSSAGVKHVVVVSDSYALANPVRDCVQRGMRVTVGFFGSVLDSRWHRIFRDSELPTARSRKPEFLDFDTSSHLLFDRQRPVRRRDESAFSELP
jgi:hypothetical protein